MAYGLILPEEVRTTQPRARVRFNAGNPLTRDLRFLVDRRVDVVANNVATTAPVVLSRGNSAQHGAYEAFTHDGTSYLSFPHSAGYDINGPLTLLWIGVVTNFTDFRMLITKTSGNGASNNPFELRADQPSGGLRLTRANAVGFSAWTSSAITAGALQVVVVTQGGNLGNDDGTSFWINGQSQSFSRPSSNTSGNATGNTQPLLIGRRDDGYPTLGETVLAASWARVLSDAEIRDISRNPWQLFEPDDTPTFYSLGSAIPTLSLPGVTEITATSARPRVYLTY